MAFGRFVAIPFVRPRDLFRLLSHKVPLWVANLNMACWYIVGMASVGTYGVIMRGGRPNNKYSLMGGFRWLLR